mmetsp:Transcript_11009/g.16633  ORF Transcript_11009/g.16633 Transcript_11009/m.16633 type:complete len:239 (-) Transcript_11009:878-1594(-)
MHASGNLQARDAPQSSSTPSLIGNECLELLIFHSALLTLGHLLEPLKDRIELFHIQIIAQLPQPCAYSIATRVLAENDTSSRLRISTHEANALRRHNFVGALVLDHAILVNAALVLKGIGSNDGLVRLTLHAGVLRHHTRGGVNVDWVDCCIEFSATCIFCTFIVKSILALERQRHDNLLQTGVPSTLTNTIYRAFELTCSIERPSQGIGSGKSQIVLTVRAKHDSIGTLDVGFQFRY